MEDESTIFVMPYYENNIFYSKVQNEILLSFRKLGYSYKLFSTGLRDLSDKEINNFLSSLDHKEIDELNNCIDEALQYDSLCIKRFNNNPPAIPLTKKQYKKYRNGLINYYIKVNDYLKIQKRDSKNHVLISGIIDNPYVSILANLITKYSYSYLYVQRNYNWNKGSGWFFYKTSEIVEPNGFIKEKLVYVADGINLDKPNKNKNIKEKIFSRKGRLYPTKIIELYKFRFSKPNLIQIIFLFKSFLFRRILSLSVVKNMLFYRKCQHIISKSLPNKKRILVLLRYQPEAFMYSFANNFILLINNLFKEFNNYEIVVKMHPHEPITICQDYSFYKKISRISKNVKLLFSNESWLDIKDHFEVIIHTGGSSEAESENHSLHTISVGTSMIINNCLRLDKIPLKDWKQTIKNFLKEKVYTKDSYERLFVKPQEEILNKGLDPKTIAYCTAVEKYRNFFNNDLKI